jgi:RNA polymerase sigma-70 factor (ECF subfamily)
VEAKTPGPERGIALERAVADLPDPYRETILLRYYGGQTCRHIAEREGVATGTVTKRLSRAYALLREALERNEENPKRIEVQS